MYNTWRGFNIEYRKFKNGGLEGLFTSKIFETGILNKCDRNLEYNLENGFLKSAVGNQELFTL